MTDERDDDGRGVVVPCEPRRRRHASKPKPKPADVAAGELLRVALVVALGRHAERLMAARDDDTTA